MTGEGDFVQDLALLLKAFPKNHASGEDRYRATATATATVVAITCQEYLDGFDAAQLAA